MKSVTEWNDKQLGNLIAIYQRLGKVEEAYYLDALSEMAWRKGAGLNFDKTFSAVLKGAKERRFLSYRQLSEESGVVGDAASGWIWLPPAILWAAWAVEAATRNLRMIGA
ncbi:hypothetical protein ACC732_26395 [Rhizobium ruizarguesonis]